MNDVKPLSMKHRSARRRGLSLIEALISLAIIATLLTAVGVAYQAASATITINDQFFRASQAARVSVNQIMAEVRKCQSGVVAVTSLELTTADGSKRTYALDSDASKLTMTVDGVTPVTYTMASNVKTVKFETDGETISMTVTIEIGDNQKMLNGSAKPLTDRHYS
jgi:prepilin-type N-terminal cleavage/methylation domain-containing protein